jgi:hypothetical protein
MSPKAGFLDDTSAPAEEPPVWTYLDPCPVCGSRPHDAPEGTHLVTGDPHWTFPHCFKCGYRVGAAAPLDVSTQFAQFQRWMQKQNEDVMAHSTMRPPVAGNEGALREQLRMGFTGSAARAGLGENVTLPVAPAVSPTGVVDPAPAAAPQTVHLPNPME